MSEMIKKRIQYSIDKGVYESAEYILNKAGISSSNLISMVYAEISRTGKIPVSPAVTQSDFDVATLINVSYNLPTLKVNDQQSANEFLSDDGGY
ncbi:MAG TPA: damage-inducible protein J [Lactobacillus sp.]|nr:damage-inducible protein J [Lactobacillus sp.]